MGKGKDISLFISLKVQESRECWCAAVSHRQSQKGQEFKNVLSYLVSSRNGGEGISLGNYSLEKLAVLENLINNMKLAHAY